MRREGSGRDRDMERKWRREGRSGEQYKNHFTATVRAKFFCERIVNLPDSANFSTLASFTRTTKTVDFFEISQVQLAIHYFSVFFLFVSVFYCF